MTAAEEAHAAALDRAGNVFLWAAHNGSHPDATLEGAAEQITAMYLRELRDKRGSIEAGRILELYFPEGRR